MAHTFTTLRHPVEKLLEAEHFLARLVQADGIVFQFELNAFLSACRSVTFLLQSAFSEVPGFLEWYEQRRVEMAADKAMVFFLKLRNLSQKAGPVSYVGGGRLNGGWTYRFVHGSERVPEELHNRDICSCCAEQLRKVAGVVADCANTFPFYSCPAAAFTIEGMAYLRYTMHDAERAIGVPVGYSDVVGFGPDLKLHYLKRELEPLDRTTLIRMAAGEFRYGAEQLVFPDIQGRDLADDLAALVDPRDPDGGDMRTIFLRAMGARIDRQSSDDA
ncbi:hypothetical protein CO657_23585 (plasmid) [Rhizobium acidisoli]|uniref:Uncharacterized protein n=1 Tax=Rhizobium acidisoli TaxID=1538158 RepID=A0AAE5WR82_9HYPH|nr:hypothetical protein [Rhizobium acidisoli]QAS80991.1 hypothetical protein CO657_23585 [Rhizobium acidisoli]